MPDRLHDLAAASSAEDFVRLLNDLRNACGLSYRSLSRRARARGHDLPTSTVWDILARPALPRVDALRAFLDACDVDAAEIANWLQVRGRLASRPGPAGGAPRQLPPEVELVGRGEVQRMLHSWLTGAAGPSICAVVGVPGVGKSALAVAAAHRAADRFPAGQIFLDLRGHSGEPVAVAAALDHCLRALGVGGADIPESAAARSALLRTRLAAAPVLLVLDNATSAEQVRPLLPGSAACRTFVTSRNDLRGLAATHDVRQVRLEPLAVDDAVRVLDAAPAEHDRALLAEVAELCGGLPLALRIAHAHRRAHPDQPLRLLRDRLHTDRLGVLEVDGDPATSVRAALSLSWSALVAEDQLLLRRMVLHPGPVIDVYAGAALAGFAHGQARRAFERLAAGNLLRPEDDRYRLHDLIRQYAAERLHEQDDAARREQATGALLDAALAAVTAAMDRFDPHHRRLPGPGVAVPEPLVFAGPVDATAWLDRRRADLAELVRLAGARHPGHAVRLAYAMWRYHLRGRHLDDWLSTHEVALAAADRIGDRTARAYLLGSLASAYTHLGRSAEAIAYYEEVIVLTRAAGDVPLEAIAVSNLGSALHRVGDLAGARVRYRAALGLFAAVGDHRNEALVVSNLAEVSLLLRDHAEAGRGYARALAMARAVGDPYAESGALIGLGVAARENGDLDEAEVHLRRGLAVAAAAGDRHDVATARLELEVLTLRRGDVPAARRGLAGALVLARATADPNLLAAALNHAGDAALADGADEAAEVSLRQALELAGDAADVLQQARAHQGLAEVLRRRGRPAAAAEQEHRAAALFERAGVPVATGVAATA